MVSEAADPMGDNPSADDAGEGGSGAAGDPGSLGSEDTRVWMERARSWQGRHDKLQAELDAMRKSDGDGDGGGDTGGGVSLDAVERVATDAFFKAQEVLAARDDLRTRFPDVAELRPDLFADVRRYRNIHEFEAAVEAAQDTLGERLKSRLDAREKEIREEYAKRYGIKSAPAGGKGSVAPGVPTLAEVHGMSISEMDALEMKHPGLIDELLASAEAR